MKESKLHICRHGICLDEKCCADPRKSDILLPCHPEPLYQYIEGLEKSLREANDHIEAIASDIAILEPVKAELIRNKQYP